MSHLFGGISSDQYLDKLRRTVMGDCDPNEVILLEVEPTKQVTQIDFIAAKSTWESIMSASAISRKMEKIYTI
jgi:hypothetical protein